MGEVISIAKAAKLLGLNRHELSRRLVKADIASFEGAVDLSELKKIAPRLSLNKDLLHERVRLIQQSARRRQATNPPRKPELELQDDLDRMHNKWLAERGRAQEYYALFDQMIDELGVWQDSDNPHKAAFALEFSMWVCKQFDD